jgi:voltage-gated potassium channel
VSEDNTDLSIEAPQIPDFELTETSVRFGAVLVLLVLIYIGASVATAEWMTPVLLALACLIVIVLAAPARTSANRAVAFGCVFVFILAMSIIATNVSRSASGISDLIVACLLLFELVVIARTILRSHHVDVQTVLGAVDMYVLIGLFFGFLFSAIERLSDVPFFTHELIADRSDFLYFSFVAMTTLGFGDLAPADNYARPLTVFEVLIGQIILVVVVARVVSMLGVTRPGRAE